jgi:hypothetical protein
VFSSALWAPNAGGEPRPEAEAQRKLLGVGSSAVLDAEVPQAQQATSPSHAGLGNQLLLFQKLEAQCPHGGQLPLKLPLGFRRGERLKQVWQLHPMAHDGLGRFVPQVFTDKETIFGVEEHPQRLGSAQEPVRQGLKHTQGEERKEG